eukprot:CAMPEP_0202378136 /NCGR_PEP_ID=MMETSP1127-20130417/16356_1 /ASSEMBLY_ACC=CAM_ASM_000462 /TAXON_ID=3047 /ORGANISM="Dunaliella tertiolecta, Strain CCMP1320" /LENGTH=50 /DNA_ID=CAMNT_0048976363 /DNA_START=267 /DNA_END=416 /DNA_ORIENTATION=+
MTASFKQECAGQEPRRLHKSTALGKAWAGQHLGPSASRLRDFMNQADVLG